LSLMLWLRKTSYGIKSTSLGIDYTLWIRPTCS
jgi:hypothetical protein